MKKFFLEHMDVIIAVLVLGNIIYFFYNMSGPNGNKGVLVNAGEVVNSMETEMHNITGILAVKELAQIEKPKFISNGLSTFQTNVSYNLSDYIGAYDANGTGVDYRVERVEYEGNDMTQVYDEESGTITFNEPGKYVLQALAVDTNRLQTRAYISLVVNR